MTRESNPIEFATEVQARSSSLITELEVNPQYRFEFNYIQFLNVHFYSMESRKLWVFTDKGIIEIVTFLKISHIDCTEPYFTVWIETMDRNNTLMKLKNSDLLSCVPHKQRNEIALFWWSFLFSYVNRNTCRTSNANEFALFWWSVFIQLC